MSTGFAIVTARWPEQCEALRSVRQRVFVQEQGIAASLEWDERDAQCHHALALSSTGHPIGTGRLLPEGRIGRLAVLPEWRGRGVGRALLQHLIELARQLGMESLRLHAQLPTLPFYRQAGFTPVGGIFQEAGIAHQGMQRTLTHSRDEPSA